MQMRTGNASCCANRSDSLAALYPLAVVDRDLTQVAKHRDESLAVVEDYRVAIEEEITGRCDDRRDQPARFSPARGSLKRGTRPGSRSGAAIWIPLWGERGCSLKNRRKPKLELRRPASGAARETPSIGMARKFVSAASMISRSFAMRSSCAGSGVTWLLFFTVRRCSR